MPRLLLLRHAKSSWGDASLDDFDRPLNSRGRAAAPQIGRYMARNNLVPDRILCSSSRRTRETLADLLPEFRGEQCVRFLDDLYHESEYDYVGLIRNHGGSAEILLVIGHNPATHDTALSLIGRGPDELIDRIETKYPTAALSVIDFNGTSWQEITPHGGQVVDFIRPRDLDSDDDAGI